MKTDRMLALADRLRQRGWCFATAESCTGGMIAAAATDLAGSSEWFAGGWVVYSNALKNSQLGVPQAVLDEYGAVSAPVVEILAEQAARRAGAQVGVSVSGVAGPCGGSAEKPVGTVWIGCWADDGLGAESVCCCFDGDRAAVRRQTQEEAIEIVINRLDRSAKII